MQIEKSRPRPAPGRRAFRVFGGSHVLITLVAVLCHQLAGPATRCVEEIVTDSATLSSCSIQGQIGISEWMSRHPIYHVGWRLERYKCVIGAYTPRIPA